MERTSLFPRFPFWGKIKIPRMEVRLEHPKGFSCTVKCSILVNYSLRHAEHFSVIVQCIVQTTTKKDTSSYHFVVVVVGKRISNRFRNYISNLLIVALSRTRGACGFAWSVVVGRSTVWMFYTGTKVISYYLCTKTFCFLLARLHYWLVSILAVLIWESERAKKTI